MVDDSAKSGMVKRAGGERRRKRRWLPGGRWRTLLPFSLSLFFVQFPIPRSSTYIPADTARCSCFYHYCYYNFGGWTSDEPMRRLSGWERYERNGKEVGERRHDPAAEREKERQNSKKRTQKMDRAERIKWWRRGRKSGYRAKEEPRGKKRASIAGFVVGLLVICSFDIIASKLFGGAWIYVPSWLPIHR